MTIYLRDIPLPDAQSRFEQALKDAGLWKLLGVEEIQLDESAVGRVLAEPIWAKISSPHYPRRSHGWICHPLRGD
jgi:putative molybdopterin biosynthesis protein